MGENQFLPPSASMGCRRTGRMSDAGGLLWNFAAFGLRDSLCLSPPLLEVEEGFSPFLIDLGFIL